MRWEIETWRKIYTGKPASWLALPVSARGLGRELLTYCDDKGAIPLGDDPPWAAIARLLSAHRGEYKRIESDIAALLKDGYLVLEGDDLVIRNFPQAQDRSGSAERQRRYRARMNGDTSDRNALRSPLRHASYGSDVSRSDGSRSDPEIPPAPAERGGSDFPCPEPSRPVGSPRQCGTNPRATGTNPRALAASKPSEPWIQPAPPPPRAEVLAIRPDPSVSLPPSLASLRPSDPDSGATDRNALRVTPPVEGANGALPHLAAEVVQ